MLAKNTAGLFISLQRTIFKGAFETMALWQDEAAELNQGWVRKMGVAPHLDASLGQWQASFKEVRSDLRQFVDNQFRQMESVWSPTAGAKIAGTIRPAADETGDKRRAA